MADKNGTLQQQRNALFPATPAKATAGCPLRGPDVAIVPMRYAIDRSRYDEEPKKLKPLLSSGDWTDLPSLKTRSYTLRQLHSGFVYVYDETKKALDEYEFSAFNGVLTPISLTDAEEGKDERKGTGEGKNHLIYPRKNTLYIAYSTKQWTWRICELMRSDPGSRKNWMKVLDLPKYCVSMSAPDTLPLLSVADAVADVYKGKIIADKRFADSAIPVFPTTDTYWTGSVPDKESALIIALDDPLAVLNDLGMQLAADQAAYQSWQQEHEHKVQIAQTVETLCGADVSPEKVPAFIRGDTAKTRQYQRDLEDYYAEKGSDKRQATSDGAASPSAMIILPHAIKSFDMAKAINNKYGRPPTESDYEEWLQRAKWRRQIDLDGAHAYLQSHQANGIELLKHVHNTQDDFQVWATYIGTEPLKLFIDTTNTKHLHYLQEVFVHLLVIYGQEVRASAWLAKEDINASSLFGTVRYGFSPGLKDALDKQANLLLNGMSDITIPLAWRRELNSMLAHDGFAEKAWMKVLKSPVQETFKALCELASKDGKATAETILMALIPSDSRLARGKSQNVAAVIRNFLIGQVLVNSSDRLVIDVAVAEKLKTWKLDWQRLNKQINNTRRQWLYPVRSGHRISLARNLRALETKLQIHELKMPGILDYQNNKYAELLREEIRKFALSRADVAKNWSAKAKTWSAKYGMNAGAVTWGVIILNFINVALTYRNLTKDGEFGKKDVAKISYGMGYSFNLLMAVFVETPWEVIKNAKPILIEGKDVGILSRSSAYWTAEGKLAWGTAVRGFSRGMVAMGAFAVVATALEFWDIQDDYNNAKSTEEKVAIQVKKVAVLGMAILGASQFLAGLMLSGSLASIVINPWFAVATLVLGAVYFAATIALNYFKNDGIGQWLRNCCWSISEDKHDETPTARAQEKRSFLEIQLSPQIYVKGTFEQQQRLQAKVGYTTVTVQNGAWVHVKFPEVLRGHLVQLNVIDSYRPLHIMPVKKIDDSVQYHFLENGQFTDIRAFGKATNKAHSPDLRVTGCPSMPAEGDDIVWKTWIPVAKNADFIELQIRYPTQVLTAGIEDQGYLYQLAIEASGETAVDGLSTTKLEVQTSDHASAMILAIAE